MHKVLNGVESHLRADRCCLYMGSSWGCTSSTSPTSPLAILSKSTCLKTFRHITHDYNRQMHMCVLCYAVSVVTMEQQTGCLLPEMLATHGKLKSVTVLDAPDLLP